MLPSAGKEGRRVSRAAAAPGALIAIYTKTQTPSQSPRARSQPAGDEAQLLADTLVLIVFRTHMVIGRRCATGGHNTSNASIYIMEKHEKKHLVTHRHMVSKDTW